MLTEDTIIVLGDGILSKIKYDFNYKYSLYDFFKTLFIQEQTAKKQLCEQLYKKLS